MRHLTITTGVAPRAALALPLGVAPRAALALPLGVALRAALALPVGVALSAALARPASAAFQAADELWSLRPPVRPPLPEVVDVAFADHPVDRFVLARLEREGLAPAPEAARATLIRRLSFDLIGLPPTPAEVRAFVEDARPDAYERLVDRLLASPHYGERMAQHWLDLARYADTNGYDGDTPRQMWAWRDWVISAFQDDMPFAEFTRAQVAGDLLPDATLAQRIATGFFRNHPVADVTLGLPGEYQHAYAADRTATFATTWLGLTVGCAECHDHKFDPLTQRDYYGLYAFFDRLREPGVAFGAPDTPPPRLQLPTAAQGSALLALATEQGALRAKLAARERAASAAFATWRDEVAGRAGGAVAGLIVELDLERDSAEAAVAGIGQVTFEPAVRGRGARLDGKSGFLRAAAAPGLRADQAFSLSAWVRPEAPVDGAVLGQVDEAAHDRGCALLLAGGRPSVVLTGGKDDALSLEARDPLPLDRWSHVLATYDGSRRREGLRLFVDGAAAVLVEPAPPTRGAPPPKPLAGDLDHAGDLRIGGLDFLSFHGGLDLVRIHGRALADQEVLALVVADLAAYAARGAEIPSAASRVLDWYLAHVDEVGRALTRELQERDHAHRTQLAEVALVSVMEDDPGAPPTRLLARGDFTQPREVVAPSLPAVFGALPDGAPRDRRALAQWLVREDHPLTWRVAANRLWRQCFGRGLVDTLDDFGTRGERPSHPELLDWLACEFAASGGSHRRLLRLLVTSRAYRQQSHVDAAHLARDPENRLLARAGRWRLDAEALRDQALFVGGMLDLAVGGPSVRPWQPADLWPEVSPPAQRLRRGLYVEVNRKTPFTSFALFDAPPRDVCTAQRQETTTPLQALALFNDPNFHAAAEGLARQLLAEAHGAERDDTARLVDGFVRCTAREPDTEELRVLRELVARQRGRCAGDELTVWTAVAAVLLNLDETLTRS